MQFPRAKRFASPTAGDIPPVGAYSVQPPPDPTYKRGAMLEKDKRFHDPNILQPDTFGLYVGGDQENGVKKPRMSSAVGGGLEKMRLQMDELKTRMMNQHEKEMAKLQAKIVRLEAVREEGVKERQEFSKELLSVKSELRSTTTREQSLAGKLAKAEASLTKHQTLLPTLQSKLEQLTTSHTESRKRKDTEIAALNEKVDKKEGELSQLRDEARENRRALREERWAREEMTRVAEKTIKELNDKMRVAAFEVALEDGKIVAALQAEINVKDKQLEHAMEQTSYLEERLTIVENMLADSNSALDVLMDERAGDREEPRSEKEWRQRARSDYRDATGLRDDAEHLIACISVDLKLSEATKWLTSSRIDDLEAQDRELEKEIEIVEGELDLAVNDEIPRLEAELDLANEGLEEMRDLVLELQEALEGKEGEVKELQERAIAEIERFEGSLEEQRRRYADKEKEVEKERTEKRRVASLLGQARSAEAALVEERDELLAELQEAENLRATHRNLVANLDYLARENAATREDNVLLVEQNAELASHQNSRQKIQVHASTRAQLADSRRAQLAVTSKLASSEVRIAQLESELQAYKSVSSLPFSTSSTMTKSVGRTRVTRPVLSDVLNVSSTPTPISGLSDSQSMPPPPLPLPKAAVSFAVSEELVMSTSGSMGSRRAQRVTMLVDENDVEKGSSKSRRLSNGGVRMTGKMSISELM